MCSSQKTVCGACESDSYKIVLTIGPHRTCYIAVPLYICGFVLLGASFQKHLSIGALVMGWGIAQVAIMINTVAICELSWTYDAPVRPN